MLLSVALLAALAGRTGVYASLPQDLSNFQGKWACKDSVLMGKPRTVADLQIIMANAKLVKGVGAGHSWNAQQFCAGETDQAIAPVMTELDKSISVDEVRQTVKVSAGILTADLLDYLAKYGKGWTLPAFPWFTFQTVAGAVATGTHGTSMRYGSLSSDAQLRALDVVLANGSFVQLSRESHPFLWRAFQVSVGRLGIITAVTFKIVPNAMVARSQHDTSVDSFLAQMHEVQDAFNAGGESAPAVQALDGRIFFWFITRDRSAKDALWRSDLQWVGGPPTPAPAWSQPHVQQAVGNCLSDAQLAKALAEGRPSRVQRQPLIQTQKGLGLNTFVAFPRAVGDATALMVAPIFSNGTFRARDASVAETRDLYRGQSNVQQYDQYEVSIPLSKVGDCYSALVEKLYGPEKRQRGFRAPGLLRFITQSNGENGFLSHTHDGPRAYINVEDYLKYMTFDSPNQDLQSAWSLLRSPVCSGRIHWGKTGWPESGFVGASEYPGTFCDFGCAVREVDPLGKLRSMSPIWTWGKNDMDSCCTPTGFDHARCSCL